MQPEKRIPVVRSWLGMAILILVTLVGGVML